MGYSYQAFSVSQVLTAANMNQVSDSIRDHIHGQDGVSSVAGGGGSTLTTMRRMNLNGNMAVNQYNPTTVTTTIITSVETVTTVHVCDMWHVYAIPVYDDGLLGITHHQKTSAHYGNDGTYLRFQTLSAANVGSRSTAIWIARNTIEAQDLWHLGWGAGIVNSGGGEAKNIVLGFSVRSSITGSFSGGIDVKGWNYTFLYTVTSANTWQKKTVNIPALTSGNGINASGTNAGMDIGFCLGVGSTYCAAPGQWNQATIYYGVLSSTSIMDTLGATLELTTVQLEVGSSATDYEHRPYAAELAACQRYYHRWQRAGDSDIYIGFAYASTPTIGYGILHFPVQMRVNPTAIITNAVSGFGLWDSISGNYFYSSSFAAISTAKKTAFMRFVTAASHYTAGTAGDMIISATIAGSIEFDARIT